VVVQSKKTWKAHSAGQSALAGEPPEGADHGTSRLKRLFRLANWYLRQVNDTKSIKLTQPPVAPRSLGRKN